MFGSHKLSESSFTDLQIFVHAVSHSSQTWKQFQQANIYMGKNSFQVMATLAFQPKVLYLQSENLQDKLSLRS